MAVTDYEEDAAVLEISVPPVLDDAVFELVPVVGFGAGFAAAFAVDAVLAAP